MTCMGDPQWTYLNIHPTSDHFTKFRLEQTQQNYLSDLLENLHVYEDAVPGQSSTPKKELSSWMAMAEAEQSDSVDI